MSCSRSGVTAAAPPWLQDTNKPWTDFQRQYDLSEQVSGWIANVYLEEWAITLNLKDVTKRVLGVINRIPWTCLCKQINGEHSSFSVLEKVSKPPGLPWPADLPICKYKNHISLILFLFFKICFIIFKADSDISL